VERQKKKVYYTVSHTPTSEPQHAKLLQNRKNYCNKSQYFPLLRKVQVNRKATVSLLDFRLRLLH
jgi:hypothetical protein